jgi:hypothetical protein
VHFNLGVARGITINRVGDTFSGTISAVLQIATPFSTLEKSQSSQSVELGSSFLLIESLPFQLCFTSKVTVSSVRETTVIGSFLKKARLTLVR